MDEYVFLTCVFHLESSRLHAYTSNVTTSWSELLVPLSRHVRSPTSTRGRIRAAQHEHAWPLPAWPLPLPPPVEAMLVRLGAGGLPGDGRRLDDQGHVQRWQLPNVANLTHPGDSPPGPSRRADLPRPAVRGEKRSMHT